MSTQLKTGDPKLTSGMLSWLRRALDAGTPEDIHELRTTDVDEAKCRQRYAVFKQHYGTLLRLKQYFPFSLIDGAFAGALWKTVRWGLVSHLRQASTDSNSTVLHGVRKQMCAPQWADIQSASQFTGH